MTTLVMISLLLAALYTGAVIWGLKGLPESISAMVYELQDTWQWVWSIWLMAVSVLIAPKLFTELGYLSAVGFFTVVCLIGAAVTPIIQQKTRKWHNGLGIAAGVLSQLCVTVLFPEWLLLWAVCAWLLGSQYVQPEGWLGKGVAGKSLFVVEVTCAACLYGALLTALC